MPNIFLYSVQYNCILTYTSNVYMHVYICVYISKHIHMHMYMFIWESHTCLWLNRIHLLGICYAISNLKDEQIMDMGLFLLFSSQIKHSQWGSIIFEILSWYICLFLSDEEFSLCSQKCSFCLFCCFSS